MSELTCFKACDIRGEKGIAYPIGHAVAKHLSIKSVVKGFNARQTSSTFAAAAVLGVMDASADVLNISLVGTDEMCWSIT